MKAPLFLSILALWTVVVFHESYVMGFNSGMLLVVKTDDRAVHDQEAKDFCVYAGRILMNSGCPE